MGNQPFYSIIMPCYNSQEYLTRAVTSVIEQSFNNWELILINDGSTDDTEAICQSFAEKDHRVKVFSKANGGYISAVNHGLKFISGLYFLMLGSDDELSKELLANVYSQTQKIEFCPDVIGFRTVIRDSRGKASHDKNSFFEDEAFSKESTLKSFSIGFPAQSKILFTRDTSKMFKTELLGSLRYYGTSGMDADGIFSIVFAHKCLSFLCLPIDGYVWYLRRESLSGRKKSFAVQADRISNWMYFSKMLSAIDINDVTSQEKYYLSEYLYTVYRQMFFSYRKECISANMSETVRNFIRNNIETFHIEPISNELDLFLHNTTKWEHCIVNKVLIKKGLKKLKIWRSFCWLNPAIRN